MTQPSSWEAYFYPETYDRDTGQGTLRNHLGELHAGRLHDLEYQLTRRRQQEIRLGRVSIERTYGADHLRAIHAHLFQDVYPWAGQYRTVNMQKGPGRGFGDVRTGEVDRYLRDAQRIVHETPWERLDLEQFAQRSATVFAYVNQAHPFREGNGRSSKLFMEHVAERSRFSLDFSRVSPHTWNSASALSGPDLDSYEPYPESLVPVFREISVDRPGSRIEVTGPDARGTQVTLTSQTTSSSPGEARGPSGTVLGATATHRGAVRARTGAARPPAPPSRGASPLSR